MDESKIQIRRREQDEQATQKRAQVLGLQYIDMREVEQSLPLIRDMLTVEEMKQWRMVPLLHGGGSEPYQFGVTSSTPRSVIDEIRAKYDIEGQRTLFSLISHSAYRAMMLRFDPPKKVVYDDIEVVADEQATGEMVARVSEILNGVGSDDVFNYLVSQADRLGASDIHVENQRDTIRIRMRIDGTLHEVAHLRKDRYRVIMATISSHANVSTAANTPQSGHMQQEIFADGASHILNLRVETVPTVYGQDVVMRLFNFDESLLQLDLLGLQPRERAEIDEVISHPRGMVLMVGPTGSGKSTTLYSMLNALNNVERKIITLEDPVEYSIGGVTQIPIDTTRGGSFAEGLRSVLRLDPDVVMVGEIRDQETARTAIQASITGHLVLSSFHANTSAAAFSRMIDLIGVNPIFSSAIRLVIAQRLVRRLHDDTKESYKPDKATRQWLKDVLRDLPDHIDKPNLDEAVLYRPVSSEDAPFGYKGRTVIMEQMVVTDEIQQFLRGDVSDVHTEAIEAAAKKEGMVTLLQAGVLAALKGETSLEEVNRVI